MVDLLTVERSHWGFVTVIYFTFMSVPYIVLHKIISLGFGCYCQEFEAHLESHAPTSIVCYPSPVDIWKDVFGIYEVCIFLLTWTETETGNPLKKAVIQL